MDKLMDSDSEERLVRIAADPVTLEGDLSLPTEARGIVLFAHGSGSSRHSPRNRQVAVTQPGEAGDPAARSAHPGGRGSGLNAT